MQVQYFSVFYFIVISASASADIEEPAPQSEQGTIEEVIIRSQKADNPFTATLSTEKLMDVPGALGDPMQAIFSLPGIVQTNEESGEPAVRGSGPDENAYIVDFLPTGYIFHEFGNSIFNENIIRDFGLKTAGFGPEYGQALGAVFDISLRNPKVEPITTKVDASFLRAGAFIEGQISEKQSFYLGYRESLIHLFIDSEEEDGVKPTTQPRSKDYQAKYYLEASDNNTLSLLLLGASEEAGQEVKSTATEALLDPGGIGKQQFEKSFDSQGVNWKHYNDHFSLHTALGHLQERAKFRYGRSERLKLIENTWTLKSHLEKPLNDTHTVTLGGQYQKQEFDYDLTFRLQACSDFNPSCEFELGPLTTRKGVLNQDTWHAFIKDTWSITDNWILSSGLHYSNNKYLKESHVDPRLKLEWLTSDSLSLFGSVGRYTQSPEIDQIIPTFGTPSLTSPISHHYVLGMTQDIAANWTIKAETYYKSFEKVVVDMPNADTAYSNNAEGEAYGFELMLEKDQGDSAWYGWLSLAYSHTERTNNETDQKALHYTDTPWLINWVMNYQLNDQWTIGMRWNYRSGLPYTPIIGNRYDNQEERYEPLYGRLNSKRAGAYHRLDLRLERAFNYSDLKGSFYVDIVNAYARKNSGSIEYEPLNNQGDFVLSEEEGLGLFPSIGVKLSF